MPQLPYSKYCKYSYTQKTKQALDDMSIRQSGKWYCLPVIAQRPNWEGSAMEIWGLVLERSDPLGQYRRVGIFQTMTAFDAFELFERPSNQWEPSSMKVKFTPNMSREDAFPDQIPGPDLDNSGEEENEWPESVITIV
jgi:hypothetical protein